MKSAPAKRNLRELFDDMFSTPFDRFKSDDHLALEMAKLIASGRRRGLQVFQGGATRRPAHVLPLHRPRRGLRTNH